MFNVGGGELLVISLLALIVLGPNRLPSADLQVAALVVFSVPEHGLAAGAWQAALADLYPRAVVEA